MRQGLLSNDLRFWVMLAILFCASAASAQTSSFTYQGRLTDGGTSANGNYDLQFVLFDSLSGGSQVGSTQSLNTVAVSNGVFTVSLDFGASAFNGTNRFLEISARPSGGGSFTILTPRQQITSTPYAVRSLNATTADSVPASGVPVGSGNYIQNSSSPQASSNFNISGNGTAGGTLSGNAVNASSQFNLKGGRVLSAPGNAGNGNFIAGIGAGNNDPSKITGNANAFFGNFAGNSITEGVSNSFFGASAGQQNTTGYANAFFGEAAGLATTTGTNNSFFGTEVGLNNTTGEFNSFFGLQAGSNTTTGLANSFFGAAAGTGNRTGSSNTLVGYFANLTSNLTNATAIGANASVTQSNSLVLGGISGVNGGTDTNVGIGTTAPSARLSVVATGDGARLLYLGTERPWVFRQFGSGAGTALELTIDNANNPKDFVITGNNVGIGTQGPLDKLHVFGDIRVGVFGTNGCLKNNNGGTITGTCSSDVRFKRDLVSFSPVLQKLTRLQPKYFFWRTAEFPEKNFGPAREAGLIGQEVEQVLPELVSEDANGFKQVDYSKLPLMLLQAMKEQQREIEELRRQVRILQANKPRHNMRRRNRT